MSMIVSHESRFNSLSLREQVSYKKWRNAQLSCAVAALVLGLAGTALAAIRYLNRDESVPFERSPLLTSNTFLVFSLLAFSIFCESRANEIIRRPKTK